MRHVIFYENVYECWGSAKVLEAYSQYSFEAIYHGTQSLEASCTPDLIPQTPTICMSNQRSRQCYDKGRKKKKAQQRLCKRDVISGRGVHTHIAIVKIDRPEGETASSYHLNITIFYTACFPSSSVCRQASAGTAIGSVGAFQSLVPQLC